MAARRGQNIGGAERIEKRPLEALIPYARNARTHSEAQVGLIAGSIREFGFNNPVLVDSDNGIIAGHGRVLAAQRLGLGEVPVIELGHLSEAQKRAYILADNRLAEQAGWDRELLALEVADLGDLGIDLGDLGFDGAELDALLNHGAADPREEETPAVPDVPVSRPETSGLLGTHRLLCGDATDAAGWSGCSTACGRISGHRSALWRELRPRAGATGPAPRRRNARARSRTTTGRTGARPGRSFPARWPMCGTGRCTPTTVAESLTWLRASTSGRRSSGPRSGSCSAGGIITGSTSPAGMR